MNKEVAFNLLCNRVQEKSELERKLKKEKSELERKLEKEKSETERKLEKEKSLKLKKEAEVESLFCWILSRLHQNAESRIPAVPHAKIYVEGRMNAWDKVFLTHGTEAEYLSYYVNGEAFFDVLEDTLKIFDGFEKCSVTYYKDEGNQSCNFTVLF